MNDLISRKALLENLKTHFDAEYNEDGRLLYSDHICTGEDVEDLIKLVNAQPTAYDVNEVVEQLEHWRDTCVDGVQQDAMDIAIDIVKGAK